MSLSNKKIGIFSFFAYVMGALSLINLVDDADLIKIQGNLEIWIEAYSLFINDLGAFLFGWIDWNLNLDFINIYFRINDSEKHFIVIGFILIMASVRNVTRYFKMTDEKKKKKIIYRVMQFIEGFINAGNKKRKKNRNLFFFKYLFFSLFLKGIFATIFIIPFLLFESKLGLVLGTILITVGYIFVGLAAIGFMTELDEWNEMGLRETILLLLSAKELLGILVIVLILIFLNYSIFFIF